MRVAGFASRQQVEMRCGSVASGMSVSVLSFLLCHLFLFLVEMFLPSLAKPLHTRADALDWIQPLAKEETMLGHLCMARAFVCVCVCG